MMTESENVKIYKGIHHDPVRQISDYSSLSLKPELINGLASLGFNRPYKIQKYILPFLFSDRRENVAIYANKNCGKTISAIIAAAFWISHGNDTHRTLVVCRTCNSARSTYEIVERLTQSMVEVTTRLVTSRENKKIVGTLKELVIVGTFDKILDLAKDGNLDLEGIRFVVFDEVDVKPDHAKLIRIHKHLNPACQAIWLSTLADKEAWEALLKEAGIRFKVRVEFTSPEVSRAPTRNVQHHFVICENEGDKLELLKSASISRNSKRVIVLCKMKYDASEIAEILKQKNWAKTELLTGKVKDQKQKEILEEFRKGYIKVLVTTKHLFSEAAETNVDILVNHGILLSKENKLDYNQYQERVNNLSGKNNLLVLSIVDDRWEQYLEESDPPVKILKMSNLKEILSLDNSTY